jgi:hypothetical protein
MAPLQEREIDCLYTGNLGISNRQIIGFWPQIQIGAFPKSMIPFEALKTNSASGRPATSAPKSLLHHNHTTHITIQQYKAGALPPMPGWGFPRRRLRARILKLACSKIIVRSKPSKTLSVLLVICHAEKEMTSRHGSTRSCAIMAASISLNSNNVLLHLRFDQVYFQEASYTIRAFF